MSRFTPFLRIVILSVAITGLSSAGAQEQSGGESSTDLSKKTQNPVSDLISIPFQNNLNFDTGPFERFQYVLNVQPVVPVALSEDWLLVTRTILPIISQPIGLDNRDFGLGDVNLSLFLSPKGAGSFTWGIGPVLLFPTATEQTLGLDKWGVGPSAVALVTQGAWVAGALVNNIWSFAGDENRRDVSLFLLQPFINYNFGEGWSVGTSPIITANWKANSGQRWTVPLGGGVGKVLRLGRLPVSLRSDVYWNVEQPRTGSDWQLRLSFAFLFPRA